MLPVRKAIMRGAAQAHAMRTVSPDRRDATPTKFIRVSIPPSKPLERIVGFDVAPEDHETNKLIRKYFVG